MEAAIPAPSSVPEVAELVKGLYRQSDPDTIKGIEKTLQSLQKSPEGWQLADALLGYSDPEVRFFGALTFTVKLHSDAKALENDSSKELLTRLLAWLIRLVAEGEQEFVTRKLCTTLMQYFLNDKTEWNPCVRHLICSFVKGEPVEVDEVDNYPPTTQLVNSLTPPQLRSVLYISEGLVQEVKRTSYVSTIVAKLENRLDENCDDVVALTRHALGYSGPYETEIRAEAVSCMATWAIYVTRLTRYSPEASDRIDQVQTLIIPALHCVHADPENTVEPFADLLRRRGIEIFSDDHLKLLSELITSTWGQQQIADMTENGIPSDHFIDLMLAFGTAMLPKLVSTPDTWDNVMVMMHQILKFPGYAIEDEMASMQALEFWGNYAGEVADPLETDSEPPAVAKVHVMKAAEAYWTKVCMPPSAELASWDKDNVKSFKAFRTDVGDFLLDALRACGADLFRAFINLALNQVEQNDWIKMEASLFCINSMTDEVIGTEECEEALGGLFGSSILISAISRPDALPRARRAAVEMIGKYAEFFIKRREYLVAPLSALFVALAREDTSEAAARAISLFCCSCRETLVPELDNFLAAYQSFIDSPTASGYCKEKVLGGIAGIVRALPSDAQKCHYLVILLQQVEKEVRLSLEKMSQNDVVEGPQTACTAVACLAAMGKGLQSGDERFSQIDLEADIAGESYWNTDPAGIQFQAGVAKCLGMISHVFGSFGEVNEAICDVFKSGFAEGAPGPFVLPPNVFVEFVLRTSIQTPRVNLVLSTTCSFLNAYKEKLEDSTENNPYILAAVNLVDHIIQLVAILSSPDTDPEVASSCVEVLETLNRHNIQIFFGRSPVAVENTLMFTIRCIQGPDVLPKRAALHFWSRFLQIANNAALGSKQQVDQVINVLGPLIVKVLVFDVSGGSQRTTLDDVSDTLRRFVPKNPRTGDWMEAALLDKDFPAPKVEEKDRLWFKKMFIA
ncbi:armadillo-type protein [Phyllosticta capitalensis]|uniref:armadillo-type protein n=1 Tax=Phyllosticta capitalensis TaxID=121624 RepID=UPI00313089C8